MKNLTEQEIAMKAIEAMGGVIEGAVPSYDSTDDCPPDPDEPNGYDEYTDYAQLQNDIKPPEAVVAVSAKDKKILNAVKVILEFERNKDQLEKDQQTRHEQAEADHSQALTDENNFRKIITALEQFTEDKLPGIIKKNVEGAADARLDRSVDDFKRQLDNVVNGLSNELYQTAQEVRTTYWQQLAKQILFAVVTSAVVAPLSIFIFKSFLR